LGAEEDTGKSSIQSIGGIIPVLRGLCLALAATSARQIHFILDPKIVLIAFGYFSVKRAVRMKPIEALPHE